MAHRPVLFLDVDGVLHPAQGPGLDAVRGTFEAEQMSLLAEICGCVDGGVKVVLTSNWRKYAALKHMIDAELRKIGLQEEVFDVTSVLGGRKAEICHWLNKYSPEKFVIVDDMLLNEDTNGGDGSFWVANSVDRHFVLTDFRIGLTRETADKCIAVLRDLVWEGICCDDYML